MFSALICSIYSGTVAGAREAFLYGIPAIAMSYDWYGKILLLAVLNHIFHIQQLLVTKKYDVCLYKML